MILQRLTIGLKNSWSPAGPSNPYEATLEVSFDKTDMKVKLSDETARRILELAADEIGRAAQVQVNDFVTAALAINAAPAIEHTAKEDADIF